MRRRGDATAGRRDGRRRDGRARVVVVHPPTFGQLSRETPPDAAVLICKG
jgi:hypothetical protein